MTFFMAHLVQSIEERHKNTKNENKNALELNGKIKER